MAQSIRIASIAIVLAMQLSGIEPSSGDEKLDLRVRVRTKDTANPDRFVVQSRLVHWDATKTALVVCDMWDQHWCRGATRRVSEIAPQMNEVIAAARRKGVLIIHAPSSCMDAYAQTPMRLRAQSAPVVETSIPLRGWCRIDSDREPALPIDDSDGGCDCEPRCSTGSPWRRQITAIEIKDEDAITDSAEAFYLMKQRGIENVIVLGVHTNMCVLGRPFSIRQMVYQGQQVVLMRDMTDSMYNSRKPPHVSHVRGTELVVEHIEKYWCPTVVSSDFTGKAPFQFSDDDRPLVAFMVNDNHYDARTSLLNFADDLGRNGQFRTCFIDARAGHGFVGTELLQAADLLVVYARREAMTLQQKKDVLAYLKKGKPLIALRTASHAFSPRGQLVDGFTRWDEFDADVLGGSYRGHLADGSHVFVAPGKQHPILAGLSKSQWNSESALYLVSPVDESAQILLLGSKDRDEQEPVAWTRQFGQSRVFYTSLGAPADFQRPVFQRLLSNAVTWALKQEGHARTQENGG
jgi:nicotinamidase-related amidase/type 1 glutamine amidotransferase